MDRTFTPKSKIPTAVDTVLSGHTNAVTAVRWHPQYGHLLASTSLDSTMRIWSVFPNKGGGVSTRAYQGSPKMCDGRPMVAPSFQEDWTAM